MGSFNGALSSLPAHELGKVAIQAAVERAGIQASDVDEVILGQVLQAGAGQGPARQAAVNAGLPVESPAWSLNQLCGSGLRAVALAAQQIAEGSAKIVIAGGQESMSQSPHAQQLRGGLDPPEVGRVVQGRQLDAVRDAPQHRLVDAHGLLEPLAPVHDPVPDGHRLDVLRLAQPGSCRRERGRDVAHALRRIGLVDQRRRIGCRGAQSRPCPDAVDLPLDQPREAALPVGPEEL